MTGTQNKTGIRSRLAGMDWLTPSVLILSVTLMEAFWVFPWLVWLTKLPRLEWPKPPLSLLSLVIVLGISFVGTRYLLNRDWPLKRVRLCIIAGAVIVIFTVVRFEFGPELSLLNGEWFSYAARLMLGSFSRIEPLVVALLIAVLLWWRGISLGRSSLNADDIYRYFVIGIIALVLVILANASTRTLGAGFQFDYTSLWVHLAGFFFFGLLAMAISNLDSIQQKMTAEGKSPALNRRWLTILVTVIGGIVTIGIIIASTVSADVVTFFSRVMNAFSDIFFRILGYIFLPFGYLVEWLYQVGMRIINFFRGQNPEPFKIEGLGEMMEKPEEAITTGLPPEVLMVLKWLFFILIAAGLIYLLSRAVFRYTSFREKGDVDEVHESLWSWDLFKADLNLLLNRLRRMAPSGKPQAEPVPLPAWYSDSFTEMLTIRQIYECLLWETSRISLPRRHYETPGEYARRLGHNVPESRELLDEITGIYVEARYGEKETRSAILAHANSLWQSLRRLLRRPETDR
jgi:hypothetical protein